MFPFSSARTHALCTRTSLNDAPQRECEVFCMCTSTQRQQPLAIELTEHTSRATTSTTSNTTKLGAPPRAPALTLHYLHLDCPRCPREFLSPPGDVETTAGGVPTATTAGRPPVCRWAAARRSSCFRSGLHDDTDVSAGRARLVVAVVVVAAPPPPDPPLPPLPPRAVCPSFASLAARDFIEGAATAGGAVAVAAAARGAWCVASWVSNGDSMMVVPAPAAEPLSPS